MIDFLWYWFGFVCGRAPDHLWAPGGVVLPCCQRCTGLYVGAWLAVVLWLVLRPPRTRRFLLVHGLFLLIMVPFGFHWLPQGALLRTLTGTLFGLGVVAFLWPAWGGGVPVEASRECGPGRVGVRTRAYGLGVGAGLVLVPALAAWGGAPVAFGLAALAGLGAVALVGLVAVNLRACVVWVARSARERQIGLLP